MKHVDITKKFFFYDENNKPVMTIQPGETVEFASEDCFQNLLTDASIVKSELLRQNVIINPSTGPVFVEGAMPGDTLKVHIDEIRMLDGYGTMALIAEEFGVLGKYFDREETVKVPVVDGVAHFFGGKVKLPIKPMVGVLAVTPKDYAAPTSTPGTYGGNMDCKILNAGTDLYLPVAVEGALLGMGDVHALQGDGEILASLEVPAAITVTVELIKGRQEKWPILETEDAWYVLASGPDLNSANPEALDGMAQFLIKRGGEFTKEEWLMMMGIAGDLEICQIADPWMTARFRMPKSITKDLKF